jgi:hypothetical protein
VKFLASAPLLIAVVLLAGCAPEPVAPTPTPTVTVAPTPTATAAKPTPTPTVASGWKECPKIVKRLIATAPAGTTYAEIEPAKFSVQRVGTAVLARSCVIEVIVGGERVTWAVLPGDQTVADGVVRDLLGGGFIAKGSDVYTNSDTGFTVLVRYSATGAALDSSLTLTQVFTPFVEPLVFLGTSMVS